MAKSIKLGSDTYLDDSGVVHGQATIKNIIDNCVVSGEATFTSDIPAQTGTDITIPIAQPSGFSRIGAVTIRLENSANGIFLTLNGYSLSSVTVRVWNARTSAFRPTVSARVLYIP